MVDDTKTIDDVSEIAARVAVNYQYFRSIRDELQSRILDRAQCVLISDCQVIEEKCSSINHGIEIAKRRGLKDGYVVQPVWETVGLITLPSVRPVKNRLCGSEE